MGVLYARVGGAWVPVVANDEVWVATDPPADPGVELWYDTDDPGLSFASMAKWETGTWTPTFTLFVPGSGATISGTWSWVGGSNVGEYGLLDLQLVIALGTGFTAWTGGHRFSIPTQFNWSPANHSDDCPAMFEKIGGTRFFGRVSLITTTLCSAGVYGVSGTSITAVAPTATTPFTWAAGDKYHFIARGRAVRV